MDKFKVGRRVSFTTEKRDRGNYTIPENHRGVIQRSLETPIEGGRILVSVKWDAPIRGEKKVFEDRLNLVITEDLYAESDF